MSSLMTSLHGEESLETHRSKRRKLDDTAASTSGNQILQSSDTSQIRWRTSAEHQSYSAKLIAALRHVRRRNSPAISGGREVRAAADTALAMAAKGRTRWSRAILTSRVKLRLTRRHKKARVKAKAPPLPPSPPPLTAEKTAATPVEKRVKALGKLVPGCRKLSFPNLLEEATDYIAALQLQVRTMAALAELLSGSTNASGSTGPLNIEPSSSHSNNNIDDDNPVY